MGKKKKKNENEEEWSDLRADSDAFQTEVWNYLLDFKRLGNRCTASVAGLLKMVEKSANGTVVQTPLGPYGFLDRGSDVLSVAHLDAVGEKPHFFGGYVEGTDPWVFSPWLDDRLGVFVVLDVLPQLGFKHDVLLCTGEEQGRSTARNFTLPIGKKYRYIVEFDRMGEDVVNYQYKQPDMEKAIKEAGFKDLGRGSYTDIVNLDHLGVAAMNIAVGYMQPHTKWCQADLRILFRQLVRYGRFVEETEGITFPFDGRNGYYHSRSRFEEAQAANRPVVVTHHYPAMLGAGMGMPGREITGTVPTGGPATRPVAFDLRTDDRVMVVSFAHRHDTDKRIWLVRHRDEYNEGRRCWNWTLTHTEQTGAVFQTAKPEEDLILLMRSPDDHEFKVSIETWIERDRPMTYRSIMESRMARLAYWRLNGHDFPKEGWTNNSLRLLWESHGDHLRPAVQEARKDYETYYFAPVHSTGVTILSHSTDFWTKDKTIRVAPLFHFNDEVEISTKNGPYRGIIACLSPCILSTNEYYYWVDFEGQLDVDGMSLALEEEGDITLLTKAQNRYGKYFPDLSWNIKPRVLAAPTVTPPESEAPTHADGQSSGTTA